MKPGEQWRPASAMVLAAGLGKRMRPLTDNRPKPLVEFAGKPLIDHVLDRLSSAGVTNAVINVHYLADQLERHLRARVDPNIIISDERDEVLDTGGGVKRALAPLGKDAFVLHNSDSIWLESTRNNLHELFAAWDDERMDCLFMLADARTSTGYDGPGDFHLLPDGRVSRRSGEEPVPFVFTGVSINHPRLFHDSPDGVFSINSLWDRALAAGRGFGMRHEGQWMHIGTLRALQDAEKCMRLGCE